MATRYVRSTDGSDADNGTTWALAKATLSGVAAIDAAGDDIYVSQSHAESSASLMSWGFAGTTANPVKIICGNDAAEPPTAVATSATVTNTLSSGNCINPVGSVYIYGITFSFKGIFLIGGSSGDEYQTYDNCNFILSGGGSGNYIYEQVTGGRKRTALINCQFKLDNLGEYILITSDMSISGGSFQSGTTTSTVGFFRISSQRQARLVVEDFDFSNCSSSLVLVDTANSLTSTAMFRNCKMPASWTPATFVSAAPLAMAQRYELWNCDNGATNYEFYVTDYAGTAQQETTIVRSSGASDGTTGYSMKVATTANAKFTNNKFQCPEITIWNDTTGASVTATVEVVTDNVTLTDAEAWLEVHYPGSSGNPQYTLISDAKANILATAASQTTSTATWTTTGLTTPVKQKLSVTFTPQQKGPIYARVFVAKASTTVYVDPVVTFT